MSNRRLYYVKDFGVLVRAEIAAMPGVDRLTPDQIAESLMLAGGAGAEYLSRFKENSRSWVVSVLMEEMVGDE